MITDCLDQKQLSLALHSLPPISITKYFAPGRAKTSETPASPLSFVKSLNFFSLQYTDADSGSKAMTTCSGFSADAIPAWKGRKHYFTRENGYHLTSVSKDEGDFRVISVFYLIRCFSHKLLGSGFPNSRHSNNPLRVHGIVAVVTSHLPYDFDSSIFKVSY